MVCSPGRPGAGARAHRAGVATQLDTKFDGDALNGLLLLETEAVEAYRILEVANRYPSTNAPTMGTNITLPNATLICANGFLGQV